MSGTLEGDYGPTVGVIPLSSPSHTTLFSFSHHSLLLLTPLSSPSHTTLFSFSHHSLLLLLNRYGRYGRIACGSVARRHGMMLLGRTKTSQIQNWGAMRTYTYTRSKSHQCTKDRYTKPTMLAPVLSYNLSD